MHHSSHAKKKNLYRLMWVMTGIGLICAVIILSLLLKPAGKPSSGKPSSVSAVAAPSTVSLMRAQSMAARNSLPSLSRDPSLFSYDGRGRMTYSGDGRYLLGIDVSEHQYDIDWAKVAADGVDFAMIRAGRRGSTAGGLYEDEYFRTNMEGALKYGIPVGVYFYSQAVTPAEALEEAEYLLDLIRGYSITMPVVFDWEIVGGEDARTYTVTRASLRDSARIFCDTVQEAGYEPMIYFTRYLAYRKYMLRELTDYGFWYAEYEEQPRILYDFDMWQYSDTGTVNGIKGTVDMNILFVQEGT